MVSCKSRIYPLLGFTVVQGGKVDKTTALFIIDSMGAEYERELKGILQAETKVLTKATRSCDLLTRDKMYKIEQKPFIVVRAAGSFGMDIVAIRGDVSFPIEVKSSKYNVLRFGGKRLEDQAEDFFETCKIAGVIPIYAFRLKRIHGDSWRVFTVKMEGLEGMHRVLNERLPKLRLTKKGNYVMEWEEGMPLSQFIDYLS